MAESRPYAVLWDMDGTIVNTEPMWMAAETELIADYGGSWSHEDGLQLVGNGLVDSARILQAAGVEMGEYEIIRWLTDHVMAQLRDGLPWRPGARELLLELRGAGVPTALVTMSYRDMAVLVAEQIDFPAFDVIVAGDDVTESKPHPEPYLRAAELLGMPIGDCLAFEDSNTGLASAVAAGARAVGIPFLVDIPESADYARWESLAGRSLDDVLAELGRVDA